MSVRGSGCTTERVGTFRHMDLPFVYHWLDRGVTEEGGRTCDWLRFIHPQCDWPGLAEGLVWNLEETRDCWVSAAKGRQTGRDRGPATMTFLSNYPNGRFKVAVIFCLLFLQQIPIFVLHTLYLLEHRACVSMCISPQKTPPTQGCTNRQIKTLNNHLQECWKKLLLMPY